MRKLFIGAVGLLVLNGVGLAQAQTSTRSPYYLQLNAGPTRVSADCTGTTSCDRKSFGLKIAAGRRFSEVGGLELSYIRFGTATASGVVNGVAATAKLRGETIGLSGVVALPLGQNAELAFRLGPAFNRSTVTGSALGVTVRERQNKVRVLAGLGIGYQLTPTLNVGADFDYTRFPVDGEPANVRMLSVYGRMDF